MTEKPHRKALDIQDGGTYQIFPGWQSVEQLGCILAAHYQVEGDETALNAAFFQEGITGDDSLWIFKSVPGSTAWTIQNVHYKSQPDVGSYLLYDCTLGNSVATFSEWQVVELGGGGFKGLHPAGDSDNNDYLVYGSQLEDHQDGSPKYLPTGIQPAGPLTSQVLVFNLQ